MTIQFLKDAVGWGFALWLVGYGLGIALFIVVPVWAIGWILTPMGTAITLRVLLKKIKSESLSYYALIGAVWAVLAIVCDYFFLYKAFAPADGYYKFDVYLYYALTFLLPLTVGWWKQR